jgi:hypothetical protein
VNTLCSDHSKDQYSRRKIVANKGKRIINKIRETSVQNKAILTRADKGNSDVVINEKEY